MSIFVYLVAKSSFSTIFIHTLIIDKFLPSNLNNSKAGYYFSTLEAAANYFMSNPSFSEY